ncbi:carbohydrate-binding module family 20 domain-containing protein [Streptomyces avicenniae]|uniref:carbohydrate-binding module family 20 domain-containing protein n=1 Tax=Streptomyces avicenniae TaxID=500153 RepID=UPI00069CBA08|nr:carbohydrate-binding module family 20 domain-containing protein [Streptomyces avicenniae]
MRDVSLPAATPHRQTSAPRRRRRALWALLAVTAAAGALLPGAFATSGTTADTAAEPPTTPLDTLGAVYTPEATTFRLWSPDSADVTVETGGRVHVLSPAELPGYTDVHEVVVEGDLHDEPYQFRVAGREVRDPYAQMVRPGSTQGVVVNAAAVEPTGGWAPTPPQENPEDAVVYELSVRNYTIDASSGVSEGLRGTFGGLTESGTRHEGVTTGIDHLKELGVTHVQLMPSYDFGTPVPNWGYDPVNYNVPEEQYSRFTGTEDRIREFKDMVNAFHRAGIRVLMDVVYNHTYSQDVFGPITPAYYTPTDLSGTGNSLDDGNPMVSRMIRDSLEHWVRNYHIDGFRLDLLGVHHHASAAAWGEYLRATYPDRALQLHGEPWCGGCTDPQEASKVRYGTVPTLAEAGIGVFNGAFRDAVKGGSRDTTMGYMDGGGDPAAVALGLRGSPLAVHSTDPLPDLWDPAFAHDPAQTVNYVSAHDDLNLWDKIVYSGATGGEQGRAGRIDRFATAVVMTSQGVPFFHEGDEFLHSKVVDGDWETAKNSYRAGDDVNALDWSEKVAHADTFRYYRDLVALRRATPALRLTSWEAVRDRMTTRTDGEVVIAAVSADQDAPTAYDTVVVLNPTDAAYTVSLPAGSWRTVLDADGAADRPGERTATSLSVTVFSRDAEPEQGFTGSAFSVEAPTVWGEHVAVVGDLPQLGAWDPARAVPLDPGGHPLWQAEVDLPAGTPFAYKYVRTTDGRPGVVWESGRNRTATVPSGGRALLNDVWRG